MKARMRMWRCLNGLWWVNRCLYVRIIPAAWLALWAPHTSSPAPGSALSWTRPRARMMAPYRVYSTSSASRSMASSCVPTSCFWTSGAGQCAPTRRPRRATALAKVGSKAIYNIGGVDSPLLFCRDEHLDERLNDAIEEPWRIAKCVSAQMIVSEMFASAAALD